MNKLDFIVFIKYIFKFFLLLYLLFTKISNIENKNPKITFFFYENIHAFIKIRILKKKWLLRVNTISFNINYHHGYYYICGNDVPLC